MEAPLLPVLPGYDNPQLIAHGTTALVFRAMQTRLNRLVAIKVITADTGSVPVNAARELATTVSLSSQPHIVSIIDTGMTSDDRPYIVMEYCEGGSYAQILRRGGPLAVADVLEVGVKIGEALHAAHQAGIVHRDVKPSNILRSKFGPALTDFGIARAPDELSSTMTREMMTPHHASPEALLHQAQSGPSDVYSLASTLWTLLVGHPPFVDPSRPAVDMYLFRDRVLHEPVPPMERADVPPWLVAELRRAMSKLPSQRHASAAAFAEALRRGALGLGPAEPENTPSPAASGRPVIPVQTAWGTPGLPNDRVAARRNEPPPAPQNPAPVPASPPSLAAPLPAAAALRPDPAVPAPRPGPDAWPAPAAPSAGAADPPGRPYSAVERALATPSPIRPTGSASVPAPPTPTSGPPGGPPPGSPGPGGTSEGDGSGQGGSAWAPAPAAVPAWLSGFVAEPSTGSSPGPASAPGSAGSAGSGPSGSRHAGSNTAPPTSAPPAGTPSGSPASPAPTGNPSAAHPLVTGLPMAAAPTAIPPAALRPPITPTSAPPLGVGTSGSSPQAPPPQAPPPLAPPPLVIPPAAPPVSPAPPPVPAPVPVPPPLPVAEPIPAAAPEPEVYLPPEPIYRPSSPYDAPPDAAWPARPGAVDDGGWLGGPVSAPPAEKAAAASSAPAPFPSPYPVSAPPPVSFPPAAGYPNRRFADAELDRRSGSRLGLMVGLAVATLLAVAAGAVITLVATRRPAPAAAPPPRPSASVPVVVPTGAGSPVATAGGPPTDVKLTDRGTSVTITWNDPSGGTVSFLIVGVAPDGSHLQSQVVPQGQTTATYNNLRTTGRYCFRVGAVYTVSDVEIAPQVCTKRP